MSDTTYTGVLTTPDGKSADAIVVTHDAPVPTGPPDFELVSHTMEVNGAPATEITEDDRVVFVSVVKNVGAGAAVPGTILDVGTYVDNDPGPPPILIVPTVWEDTHVGGLAPGDSITLRSGGGPAGVNYWTATPGTHPIWGVVDPNAALLGRYAESSTTNNTVKLNVTVKPKVTPPTPPSVTPGGKAALVATRGAWSYTGGGPSQSYYDTAVATYGGKQFVYTLQNLATDTMANSVYLAQMCLDGYGPKGLRHPIPVMSFLLADAGTTMAQVGAGAWDLYWTQIGNIGKQFAQGCIYRLGWEFNGNWYYSNICGNYQGVARADCTPANHKAAFRRAALAIRAVHPKAKFDWCLNGGIALFQNAYGVDPRAAYPGADVVDYIGLDEYESMPSNGQYVQLTSDFNWIQAFARDTSPAGSGGKQTTYPEFGLFLVPHEGVTEANHIPWLTKFGDLLESQPASGPGSLGYHLAFEVWTPVTQATNWAGMYGCSEPAQKYWASRIS